VVPVSRRRADPGAPRVPTTLAPTSRLRAAPGVPHVPVALAPTSRLRAAPGSPHVTGRKRERWSGTRLPAQGSSEGTMCHGPEEGAMEWYPPPGSGQLRGCHVSRAGRGGGGVVPASRLRTAPGPPCVTWAATPVSRRRAASGAPHVPVAPAPTPGSGQLWGRHMSWARREGGGLISAAVV
jgi:hypothetical protein